MNKGKTKATTTAKNKHGRKRKENAYQSHSDLP